MDTGWTYVLDVVLATVLIRVVLGLLINNRSMLRFLVLALLLAGFIFLIEELQLPFTRPIVLFLAVPVALLLVANILPELRRLYQAARLGRLFGVSGGQQAVEILPELTNSILEMAQNRLGAIFVFPGDADVNEFVHGGEPVEARVNKSLLLSLFNTKSPRHDGAAIIEGDDVVRIGAVLPLASAANTRSEWGTRHLAALGLTQQCDAQVVVISEERGTISHGKAGELRRVYPANERTVGAMLTDAMRLSTDASARRRRRLLMMTLWLAALAVAAVGSKVIADYNNAESDQTPEFVPFPAGIVVTNVPSDLYIEGQSELSVTVRLEVPPTTGLFPVAEPDLRLNIDLGDYPVGEHTIAFTSDMLDGLPDGWSVDSFNPDSMEITLARARIIDIPVKPSFNNLDERLMVSNVRVTPPAVKAEVRDTAWTDDRALMTKPIDLENIREPRQVTFRTEVQLPERVKPVSGAQRIPVTVVADIVEKKEEEKE